jgi:antitoxin MazE
VIQVPLVKVKKHSQITIPTSIRRKFRIVEGDYLEIEDLEDGLILKPVKMVRPDQAYFYTREWQAGETEADQDIAEGNVLGPFDNATDALDALKKAKI